MASAAVHLSRLGGNYLEPLRAGLEFTGFFSRIVRGTPVVLKPNLTFPVFRPGVMTGMDCIEALIIALKDHACDVIVAEGDGGGYNKFKIDEVFRRTGLTAMARRYGVRLANLSSLPSRCVRLACGNREATVSLPLLFLDDPYQLITMPVPKMHCLTGVSLSLKNQWGCLPDPHRRLALHPHFDWLIWELNRVLKPALVVMDGRFALNRNGPLLGDVVASDWLLLADDLLTADVMACRLLGVDPAGVPHLSHAAEHQGLPDLEKIRCNTDFSSFIGQRFYLRRDFWDWPGYLAFRHATINWLCFRSPLAGLLHRLMYVFRREFYDYGHERSLYSDEEWGGRGSGPADG
jgi:uncharacterized protein (DUF362 family)